jgi:ubiquinone/menaquinone biosynthesis C-methylase UbiE
MSTANAAVVRTFNTISRVYDNRLVQRFVYRANHDAVIEALRTHGARRVLDVGCGTGILAVRIERDLNPELVYGCDPSAGMLEKARARSGTVRWIEGAASGCRSGTAGSTPSSRPRRFSSSTSRPR